MKNVKLMTLNGPPTDKRDLTTKSEKLKVMHILKATAIDNQLSIVILLLTTGCQ